MKHYLLTTLLIGICSALGWAGNGNNKTISPEIKEQAQKWMQSQPVQFIENKGQLADDKGNPIPFVLFKASAPGMDMYVTEKGLTYLFLKAEEEKDEKEEKESEPGRPSNNKNSLSQRENGKTEWSRVDMELKGAVIRKENILKESPSATDFNFFYGHCPDGIYGVKQYEKITIKNIYSNIDWVLYNSSNQGFKYDFIVHPNADPTQIKLLYRSAKQLQLNKDGRILIQTPLGTLTENAPVSYLQESGKSITSSFTEQIIDKHSAEVAFQLSNFELSNSQTLVIDPQLVWGTFFGGGGNDGAMSVDCDVNGNIYIAGYTAGISFPVQAWGTAYYDGIVGNGGDVFICRFSSLGNLDWATYYGGDNSIEYSSSIDVGANGNVYVTGYTWSDDFPTFNPGGGAYYDSTFADICCIEYDSFILCFSNAGVRNWATYYGALWNDGAYSITTDLAGNIYVAGYTNGAAFTTQPGIGAFAGAYYDNTLSGGSDAFILRFSPAYNLEWATLYGGSSYEVDWSGCSITTDVAGNLYVTGMTASSNFNTQPGIGAFSGAYYDNTLDGTEDAFILRFSKNGVLEWATYYGGDSAEVGLSIKNDITGNIYVTGMTRSTTFPTQPWGSAYYDATLGGLRDAFILRFDAAGVRTWATYYGGSGEEYPWTVSWGGIAIDNCGNTYVSFATMSADIDTLNAGCGSYYDGIYGGGSGISGYIAGDVFLTEFSKTGQLTWATYIGGSKDDFRNPLAIDGNNNLYLCGEWANYTSSAGMPVINPGGVSYYDITPNGADDSFILKFIPILPTYTQPQVNPVCTCNGSATVNVTCASSPINYIWSNGSSTLSTTNLSNTINNLCPGNYWVEVTDASCNRDTLFFTLIDTSKKPTVIIGPNVSISLGGSTTLTASGGVSYNWSPINGLNNPNVSNPIASPSVTTQYCVKVTGINGCMDSACVTVYVETPCPDLNLALPNAFSPNKDGENDEICLQGGIQDCIKDLSIIIYDRWGEKVYESNDKKFCWDGKYKNKLQNSAVFVYYMEATTTNNTEIIKQGNISLVR